MGGGKGEGGLTHSAAQQHNQLDTMERGPRGLLKTSGKQAPLPCFVFARATKRHERASVLPFSCLEMRCGCIPLPLRGYQTGDMHRVDMITKPPSREVSSRSSRRSKLGRKLRRACATPLCVTVLISCRVITPRTPLPPPTHHQPRVHEQGVPIHIAAPGWQRCRALLHANDPHGEQRTFRHPFQ